MPGLSGQQAALASVSQHGGYRIGNASQAAGAEATVTSKWPAFCKYEAQGASPRILVAASEPEVIPTLTREPINCFWKGGALSPMEIVSIRSWLHHGHSVNLWTYEFVEGVPTGVTLQDANEIMPWSDRYKCIANFSDEFRCRLLSRRRGLPYHI